MTARALPHVELVEAEGGGCVLVVRREGHPPTVAPLTVDDALALAAQLVDGADQ